MSSKRQFKVLDKVCDGVAIYKVFEATRHKNGWLAPLWVKHPFNEWIPINNNLKGGEHIA